MEPKIIEFENKYASGFCRLEKGTTDKIRDISLIIDKQGGYIHPYICLPDRITQVIQKGDKIKVLGKKVIEIIKPYIVLGKNQPAH